MELVSEKIGSSMARFFREFNNEIDISRGGDLDRSRVYSKLEWFINNEIADVKEDVYRCLIKHLIGIQVGKVEIEILTNNGKSVDRNIKVITYE